MKPLEPLAELIRDFLRRGGKIWACTPCVKSRGYGDGDFLEGVEIAGASKMHEPPEGRSRVALLLGSELSMATLTVVRARLEAQGFRDLDEAALAEIGPWMR